MTGKRKNEQFDIISQAQRIVDEYEDKYFKCLGEAFIREKRNRARRNALLAVIFVSALMIAAVFKILF